MSTMRTPPQVPVLLVARTGSTRLPRKILLDICGKPLVAHQLCRIQQSELIERVVLCTTVSSRDDELVATAKALGVEVFRGSETDVPRRLLAAADAFGTPFFVMVEGDEALVDAKYIDRIIEARRLTGADFIRTNNLPIGSWVCGISTDGLRRICSHSDTDQLDGWGSLFEKEPGLRCVDVAADAEDADVTGAWRLTVDYAEDFELLRKIYDRLYSPGQVFPLSAVVALLREDESIATTNRHLVEAYWQRIKERSVT